ncbi:MAG: hypothetical protein HZA53_18070 [Planctomycetes bacterium]|nr:hypothetical protein [Planctomycetota bacterium]
MRILSGAILGLGLATACSDLNVKLPARIELAPLDEAESTRARETVQLGFAFVDRQRDAADPVEDAFSGWSLWYAHDLWGGILRPSAELGAGYSEHAVEGFREAQLEVFRLCAGGRLTLQPERSPISVYGRTGWFYRFSWDPDFEAEPYDQDGGGYYLGAGLDVEFGGGLRGGLFLDYFKGSSIDPLEERFYGVSIGVGF